MSVDYEYRFDRYKSVCEDIKLGDYEVDSEHFKSCRRATIGKRILMFQCIIAVLIIFGIPLTGYAAYNVSRVVYEKVKGAGYTDEEIDDLSQKLNDWGFTEDELRKFEPLKVNGNGQTYGPDDFGADLILVELSDGTRGYIYRTDFEAATAPATSIDQIKEPEEVELNVYDSDGETVVGVFKIQ